MEKSPALPEPGWQRDGFFNLTTRVYLEDVDAGGIVYHANYLKYAERARTELIAAGGIRHAQLMALGGGVIVKHLTIGYLRPLRLEEILVVRTRILNIAAASATLEQLIERAGERCAEMTVELVYLNPSGRPARWPVSLLAAFSANQGCKDDGSSRNQQSD